MLEKSPVLYEQAEYSWDSNLTNYYNSYVLSDKVFLILIFRD